MPANPPIRLTVCDADIPRRAPLAGRLRDVAIDFCDDPAALRGLLRSADAVLVADPVPPLELMESLVAVATGAGRQLALVNPDRYLPSRRLVRQQLAGPLGDAGLVRIHRWETCSDQNNDVPGPLLRDIDVALWLAGRAPDRVFAVGRAGQYVQVHLGFANGAMALLDYSSRLPDGDGYQSLSVIAAHGAAYADDHQNMQLLYRGGNAQAVRTEERTLAGVTAVRELAEALRAGRDVTTASAAEWRNVFVVADAVQKSLRSRQAIALEGR